MSVRFYWGSPRTLRTTLVYWNNCIRQTAGFTC